MFPEDGFIKMLITKCVFFHTRGYTKMSDWLTGQKKFVKNKSY